MDLQLHSASQHLYGETKREMRIAASLPEAHRETRGHASILRACAENQTHGGFMKLKLVVSLFAASLLLGATARAQDSAPKVDVFVGYSYLQANPGVRGVDSFHLHGGSASVAYNYKTWLSGVADIGGYTNGKVLGTNASGTLSTYLFGPRVSYRHFRRVTPFGQVLFGVGHANSRVFGTANSENAFAMSVGGGVDYKLFDHFSIRPVQADYLLTRFGVGTAGTQSQNNVRLSTGFVFRF
jgi:opacity protein-like surface antigen